MPQIIQGPFVGATSSTAGAQGLVPAPAAGDEGKSLLAGGGFGVPIVPPTSTQTQGTFKEFGGEVAYIDDYDFRVSPATYVINGARHTSALTDLSLSAAHATLDRFDSIVVNSSDVATIVTGTAAANPAFPDIDPLTQLVLTTIRVDAASTEPAIVPEDIYKENAEWTTSVSGNFDANSASSPFEGTKCVLATAAANGHYVRFTRVSPISLAAQKQLVLMIESITNDWPNQKSLRLTWYLSGAKVGQTVTVSGGRYGFVDTNVTTDQQLVIPVGDFVVPASTNVDRLEILVNGSGAAISFRLDNIVLEPESTDAVQTNPGTASASVSGTVKTTTSETDPVVYTKPAVDVLLALKADKTALKHYTWSFNPKAVCDGTIDRLFLMRVGPDCPNGLKITQWNVSFDADPTTEADLDFKRADAFIGAANSAVMDVLDTTAGASSETTAANINSDTAVANGKVLYLEFGTAYTADNLQIIFEFWAYAV